MFRSRRIQRGKSGVDSITIAGGISGIQLGILNVSDHFPSFRNQMEYNFKDTEIKWQKRWKENKTYRVEADVSKPKYYVLDMFPYPSGAGLHVGHPLGYIASDIYARYKRLKGFCVLHPMGFDAFGLPAEQYAIQTGQHPAVTTGQNIKRYREQLDKIGLSFDWDREIRTSDPEYYRWTQWIFLKLFNAWYNPETNRAESIDLLIRKFENGEVKAGEGSWKTLTDNQKSDVLMNYRLAYLSEAIVNWCPALGTVLANDEVKDGLSERGGYPVERKKMKQWSLRITSYAQRLLEDLEPIDWTESIKEQQRNWIGRSEGTTIEFRIQNSEFRMVVFTTRPDTVFGVSYMTLAPEHELVEKITTDLQRVAVMNYVEEAKNRSDRERMADVKRITGVFTGAYAEHPFTKKPIPVWVGDYVLAGYGTGAVMAVPAHDSRDFAFAAQFNLPRPQVIQPPGDWDFSKESFDEKSGTCINSDFLNGLNAPDAIRKAIEEIERRDLGKRQINFRLRDAAFGRQRYWGEPIPIYYENGIPKAVDEKDLPIILPEVDKYLPTEDGEPPLARAKNWKYKNKFEYEATTMPGWAGSSWYYLRYMDPQNNQEFVSKDAVDYWKEVDLYVGGAEHATGHLLYVRFWTKFLFDLGYIPFQEPARKLINQGMIQGRSNFVYRMDIFGAVTNFTFPIFISKGIHDKIQSEELLPITLIERLKIELKKKIDIDNSSKLQVGISKLHVDVNLVNKDELNLEQFRIWREENKGAVFFLENGSCCDSPKRDGVYVCGFEVEKMSKSKWNVVSPDEMIDKYGADCLRLYEMFLGPLELSKPWNTNGISGTSGFIRKLWKLFHKQDPATKELVWSVSEDAATPEELKVIHKTIKKITEDIERFSFNTSVSNFMICVNELTGLNCNKRVILEPLVILVSPYAPHIAEELWEKLGHQESVTRSAFPDYKAEYLAEDSFDYPISLNGKTKFNLSIALSLSKDEIEKHVLQTAEVRKLLEGKSPKKIVVVPGRIVNIVV